jgi:hypothetical protein
MFQRELIQDLQSTIAQWYREHGSAQTVAEVEQAAEQIARAAGAAVIEVGIAAVADNHQRASNQLPCSCGHKAYFKENRPRDVATLYGAVAVKRAYYRCPSCGQSQMPWDSEQGLNQRSFTPRVKALVAQVAARSSYKESVELLDLLAGFKLPESTAEALVAEVGGRIRAEEQQLIASYDAGEIIPLVSHKPACLYVSMDGTSAHIDKSWHEVKTGVVYEGRPGPEGLHTCVNQCYVAAQETAEQFGQRLYVTAAQAGVQYAHQTVVIGDGAEWIWNLSAHHYVGATEIVDYWHACEHIYDLARLCYSEGDANGKRWAEEHKRKLKEDGPTSLLRALKRMKPKTDEQREAIRREIGYFTRNRKRMQYAKFRAQGLMIGSGPAEAACKVVVGERLKCSGMRWSGPGADSVLAIRTRVLNRQWDVLERASKAA